MAYSNAFYMYAHFHYTLDSITDKKNLLGNDRHSRGTWMVNEHIKDNATVSNDRASTMDR